MRRRRLLHAGALSATLATAGCVGSVQRAISGSVFPRYSHNSLHRADEPVVRGGLDADSDAWTAGRLVTEPPTDPVFVDDDGEDGGFTADFEGVDFEREFALAFEVRSTPDDPYRVLAGAASSADPRWTGWSELTLPLQYYADDSLEAGLADADELVCTLFAQYETRPEERPLRVKPTRATVELYDEEGGRRGGTTTVTAGDD
ncbi:hypothetical protein ACFO0N_13030 [Halobium salinum]|uniref:Lipoprotein n=1 Tax=Halobium salinum TaxID=1364940 RepID=A0ABD5PEK3_9EURY|nr:hypothetical protein [Halobium salinum]